MMVRVNEHRDTRQHAGETELRFQAEGRRHIPEPVTVKVPIPLQLGDESGKQDLSSLQLAIQVFVH